MKQQKHDPVACIDGAAWWPDEDVAKAWAYLHVPLGYEAWRVIPFHGGFAVETSPFSGSMFNEQAEAVEV